jgi:hypothetical protein
MLAAFRARTGHTLTRPSPPGYTNTALHYTPLPPVQPAPVDRSDVLRCCSSQEILCSSDAVNCNRQQRHPGPQRCNLGGYTRTLCQQLRSAGIVRQPGGGQWQWWCRNITVEVVVQKYQKHSLVLMMIWLHHPHPHHQYLHYSLTLINFSTRTDGL